MCDVIHPLTVANLRVYQCYAAQNSYYLLLIEFWNLVVFWVIRASSLDIETHLSCQASVDLTTLKLQFFKKIVV